MIGNYIHGAIVLEGSLYSQRVWHSDNKSLSNLHLWVFL